VGLTHRRKQVEQEATIIINNSISCYFQKQPSYTERESVISKCCISKMLLLLAFRSTCSIFILMEGLWCGGAVSVCKTVGRAKEE
jgi:hypothetical protein